MKCKISFNGPIAFIFFLMMLTGGCSPSRPSNFYLLTPMESRAGIESLLGESEKGAYPKQMPDRDLTIGLGPVKIAEYIDRTQLVVRSTSNEIVLEEFKHWAGPLKDVIPAVLLENLSLLLSTDKIVTYPWKATPVPDVKIEADILRLDGKPGDMARLKVRWKIIDNRRGRLLGMGKADFTEPVGNAGFDAFTAAQSRLLARFSILLARELIHNPEAF